MSWVNGFVDVARHRKVCVAHMRCKVRRTPCSTGA